MVQDEHTAWPTTILAAQGADVDARWPTVHRMRAGIASAGAHLLRLNHLHNAWLAGIGLGIDNVQPRRAQPWDDEVTPFEVRVWRIRTQSRATGIPAKVMQFIPR